MKKLTTVLLLTCMVMAMLASCTGTTPDAAAKAETEMTLDAVNWSVPITIEATGETVTYTMEQAKAHDLTKTYISAYQFENKDAQGAPQVCSLILEGVKFSDVLADIGVTEFSSITCEHNNMDNLFEYDYDVAINDGTVIGWIQNKKEVIEDSYPSYCAFGSSEAGVHDYCHSLKSITIHQ